MILTPKMQELLNQKDELLTDEALKLKQQYIELAQMQNSYQQQLAQTENALKGMAGGMVFACQLAEKITHLKPVAEAVPAPAAEEAQATAPVPAKKKVGRPAKVAAVPEVPTSDTKPDSDFLAG